MRSLTSAQKLVFCVLLVTLMAIPALPQASTGSVSGTVRDQSGAAVPGASVALTNTATNIASKSTTNESGYYLFPGVNPGPYTLSAESSGMQKFEGSLTVLVQQSMVVDVPMQVGLATTQVSVKDVTPLLQVDSATLGHTLERTRIE